MKQNINSNVQVKPTLGNIVNCVLYAVVHFMILHRLFHGYGKLRVGDYVKYNWMAKYYIRSVYDREPEVRQISNIDTYSDGTEHCDFKPLKEGEWGGGCDTFWIRKCYGWERPHNGI
jgi:hypothetical protein